MKYVKRFGITLGMLGSVFACALSGSGCAPLQSLAGINVNTALPKSSSTSLSTPVSIDAGAYETNNDTGRGCLDTGAGDTGLLDGATLTRGCMEQPPIVNTDGGAWFVGFYQNYLFTAASHKFSAFVNTSYFSGTLGLFGILGAGLNMIDTGMGIAPTAVFPAAAARRMRFAKMNNGNIISIFLIHDPGTGGAAADDRVVFANIYDVTTHTWGTATQLGTTGKTTDVAVDLNASTWNTPFCAPAVAAAPDNTAIATWCETVGAEARLMYSQYIAGAWTAASPLVPNASNVAFPGFSEEFHTFTINTLDTTTIQSGDTIVFTFDGTNQGGVACSSDCTASVTMKATTSAPSSSTDFQILTKADGTVLVCQTMQQMLARALGATPTVGTKTLGQRGVSTWINPNCSDTSAATWKFAVFFNKAQGSYYRTIGDATDNSVGAVTCTIANAKLSCDAGTILTNAVPYSRNALVDIAGDGYGNYAMVRTVVAPVFDDNDASTVGSARQLVGHVFQAGTGFVTRSGSTDPEAYEISRNPSCYSGRTATIGTTYYACSVRHPKILMSQNGFGLVLYYQNQLNTVSSTVGTASGSFPNRLWFSSYTLAGGFSTTAATVDSDVICSTSDFRNDESVCEGGSSSLPCQLEGEPASLPLNATAVDTDIPPVAAAMNSSGQAIIAYHKYYYTTSGSCSSYIGVNVAFYDPSGTGMGSPTAIDDGLGNTMHASVAMNANGYAAVVWEEVISSVRYVYVRTYKNGTWSDQQLVNSGYTNSSDAAMPSVAYSDTGQVLITFTANTGTGTTRRQYEVEFTP